MVPGTFPAAGVTFVYLAIQAATSTVTQSIFANQYTYEYPQQPRYPSRRSRLDDFDEFTGYVGSCWAFYVSPRVDRSVEVLEEVPAACAPIRGAVRRMFGAPRQRVPLRSRPGANALAA